MVGAIDNLLKSLVKENNISPERIVSIQFTQTSDLIHMNAAAALRIAFPDYSALPLFCSQEPEVIGMLPRTVRILITWHGKGPAIPVYLGDAALLRPDLQGQS
jgi:chorismate mutase